VALSGGLTAAPAHAAAVGRPHLPRAGLPAAAPTRSERAGALTQLTGIGPSQVTAVDLCPPVAVGHARCQAQALLVRSSGRLLRPRIRAADRFTAAVRGTTGAVAPRAVPAQGPPQAGTPAYLQQAYDLTYLSQTAGAGDTVAVVDAYDDPSAESDLAVFRSTYGLPPCTTADGCFSKVNEYGAASPLPAPDSGWQTEISLDLDAVSSLCPNCRILLVEAASTSAGDMDQAETTAAALGARQISDSWSVASSTPIPGTYSFPGASVIAAAGDNGYNGPGWDAYPAALPDVTAAGGTTLTPSSSQAPSARGFAESAWSLAGGWGTGSGCDVSESKPAWQSDTGCTGRSYADVSADADPDTGLAVYDSGAGGWMLVGGTSLAAPLIAAYEAVTGVPAGDARWAYADEGLLNDPVSGSNGSCGASIAYICNAGPGYDGPTGAGSISGDVVAGAPGVGGPTIGSGTSNTYAQSVSAGAVTLVAGIWPNQLATTYWWQYGPTDAYGQQSTPGVLAAAAPLQQITTQLSGLEAGTTYHYRLVASNADGTTYGYDYTFTTPAGAPQPEAEPALSGAAVQGQTLTASTPAWSPSGSVSIRWQRSDDGGLSWTTIPDATAPAYTLGGGDAGELVRVLESASNAYGTGYAASAPVGPVAPEPRWSKNGRAHGHPRAGRASVVLTVAGRARALRANGRSLATAIVQGGPVATVAAASRSHRRARPRLVLVRRLAAATQALSVRACARRSPGAGPRRCTRPVALRRVALIRLPAWLRGPVTVDLTVT